MACAIDCDAVHDLTHLIRRYHRTGIPREYAARDAGWRHGFAAYVPGTGDVTGIRRGEGAGRARYRIARDRSGTRCTSDSQQGAGGQYGKSSTENVENSHWFRKTGCWLTHKLSCRRTESKRLRSRRNPQSGCQLQRHVRWLAGSVTARDCVRAP